MIIVDLVRLFAETLATAIVLTDIDLERPGPTILYANPAFERMSGYTAVELLGASPRLLQGVGTNPRVTQRIARKLRTDGRYHGVLENYRKSGQAYLCEIDVRPLVGRSGELQAFVAFEREVVRRRSRPSQDPGGRYRPITSEPLEFHPLCSVPCVFG